MPTDLELIQSFTSMSSDARQVLLRLVEFVAENKTVTWQLSGGVNVSADSLPKMIAGFNAEKDSMFRNFERNFGGVVGTSVTRSTDGIATAAVITYASGNLL
ncbi:MAG TPA: hypothetical protein VLH60_05060, partial [Sedimentisphaerales bacterium]|nr:hypothetical protein [Sedimentisphaerales bacterium]